MARSIQRKARTGQLVAVGLYRMAEAPKISLDAGFQHLVVERLGDKVVSAGLQRLHNGVAAVQAGDKDDRAVMPVAQPGA